MKAWLEGDEIDLRALTRLLAEGDVRVLRDPDEGAYYLTAAEIDNPPSGTAFYEAAKKLLIRVNGFGRLADTGYRSVKLNGRFSEGNLEHHVIVPRSAEIRLIGGTPTITVTRPDGTVVPLPAPPPSPGPDRFALASKHSDVDEVFEIMSQTLRWSEFFKIHEIIQDSVGGSIPKMGWASKAEDNAFTASANRRDISGSDARHARKPKGPLPKRTMTVQQGRDYISRLVIKWLDWLRSQP